MAILFWLVLGAAVGSFLNVCIYRLPRGESIVYPPSHCPSCGKKLIAPDLIPFVSYFLLFGKCRYCKARISFRYPLVELLTALGFVFSWMNFQGDVLRLIFQLIFISVLIIIFFTDLELQVIPDAVSFSGIFAGLTYNLLHGGFSQFLSAFCGMLLGFLLLYAVGKLGELWFKKEVMGQGDFYLAALLGAGLGSGGALLSIFLAYLLAAAAALVFLALRKLKFGQYIPFGPALAAGGIITLFWGEGIWLWYLGIFI